jgi:hypothetical protein
MQAASYQPNKVFTPSLKQGFPIQSPIAGKIALHTAPIKDREQ